MSDRFGEHDFLGDLRRAQPADPRLIVGIGDDAALHRRPTDAPILLAIDTVMEGTHTMSGPDCPEELARKAVRSNVSDIAAMGGRPEAILVSLNLPRKATRSIADRVMATITKECARFDIALAGGDTVVGDGPLTVTVAITGHTIASPVRRAGARVGDLIMVTGSFGGSILGRHTDFMPRLQEAADLVRLGPPSAMADVSDGLLRDLQNILDMSGVGAIVRAADIPIHEDAFRLAQKSGRPPLEHALHDGEDFELIFTMPPEKLDPVRRGWRSAAGINVIGCIVESGLYLDGKDGVRPIAAGGYDHGAAGE